MGNIARWQVGIRGTRTLVQHRFGPESIPLTKGEKTGVAGNDPEEYKRTCILAPDPDRRLCMPRTYAFGCLRNAAVHTKKGKGSIQSALVSTLQVEEPIIYLNRVCPPFSELVQLQDEEPIDPEIETFIYVATVKNPATKGRNVRYRLATRPGWECSFSIKWDVTLVGREQMRAILIDAGQFCGLGDGLKVGMGRWELLTCVDLDADKTAPAATRDGRKRVKETVQ